MDVFLNTLIGLAIGASAGALSAFLGWNKSGEPFDAKKFISGLATGVITGVVAVLGITAAIGEAVDQTALLVIYVTLFVGIIGVDNARTAISGTLSR
jgi:hypothetical protein